MGKRKASNYVPIQGKDFVGSSVCLTYRIARRKNYNILMARGEINAHNGNPLKSLV